MNRQERLTQILTQEFQPEFLRLVNESHQHSVPAKSETHFQLVLVSEKFEGQSKVQRSRRVHEVLHEELQTGLHALTQRLMSPSEWAKVKDGFEMKSPPCHGGSRRS
jgi:BolA protein